MAGSVHLSKFTEMYAESGTLSCTNYTPMKLIKNKRKTDKRLTVSHVQQQLGKVVIQASALKGAHSYHRTFDNCAWGECAVGLRTTLGKVLVA